MKTPENTIRPDSDLADFLETLLWASENDDCHPSRKAWTIHQFHPEFTRAAEEFLSGFREYLQAMADAAWSNILPGEEPGAEDTAWHAVKITLRDPQPVKSWQLYKRNLKTDAVSLLHPDLTPMTETEARSCENAFAGTYQPAVHVFASLINPKWEA